MKVRIKSKLGRPFWRFGKALSPDEWTEIDLTPAQLREIRDACLLPVSKGGALEIDPVSALDAKPKT